ncbi:hypothetical protein EJ03DRAFT_345192 [Teratosphaeria nubilosa]|uniref:Aminoglycoside phosphotransferase domain-containing protein n=1 Tax=Teratosphaeria nubilosa TaxID=161662 RepID=A0A6G1L097_9PEZI|nr:hypothetical protein EJ03DRAFT_345192 [Teratosphaeria nubilosa]
MLIRQVDEPDAFFAAYDAAKEAHVQALLARADVNALLNIAGLVAQQMGGQNCHLDISFEDGVVWIARLRLEEPTVPPFGTRQRIFASEVNTLRFLAQTSVPVPEVFYYTSEPRLIGTPFMLMEKMPGEPLQWSEATAQQRTKNLEQLVDVFLELEKYPLPATGSLSSETGRIGQYAQARLFATPSRSIGPFQSLEQALTSISEHEMTMIESGELSTLAADNYLTQLWRLDRAPDLVKGITDDSFYLKHFDDKGDHILSRPSAFSSPCMLWPVGEFYEGKNQLSTEEIQFADMFRQRGREDIAQLILKGRKFQRFSFFLGSAVPAEREESEALFQGLRKAVDDQDTGSYLEWRNAAIARVSESDPILKRLLRAEEPPRQDSR